MPETLPRLPLTERPPDGAAFDDGHFENTVFKRLREPNYAVLAELMGSNKEIAMFRKFDAMNMLSLLSMQAELIDLERELENEVMNDERSEKPETRIASKYFHQMRRVESDSGQWEKIVMIRRKLKEYRTTLLEVAQVSALAEPHRNDRRTLRRWLRGSQLGEGHNFLMGSERFAWDLNKDLASLNVSTERSDLWTETLTDKLVQAYNFLLGRFIKTPINRSGMIKYSGLKTTTTIMTSVLAAMLPAVSTVPLYYEKRMIYRIAIMIGFTTIFALTLAILTPAKRIEIFSATAAFAAVEVVFIGSADNLP